MQKMEIGKRDKNCFLPQNYKAMPIQALSISTRKLMSEKLNGNGVLVEVDTCEEGVQRQLNNFIGVAEIVAGWKECHINTLSEGDEFSSFLNSWESGEATLGNLCEVDDCKRHMDDIQISEVESSNNPIDWLTVDDVKSSKPTFYHAYISYDSDNERDTSFVHEEVIPRLEGEFRLKSFVPGDLPAGHKRKLIPLIIENVKLPRFLKTLAPCDLSNLKSARSTESLWK
ncbi:hypothetical protein MAR_020398, partial [Mya arenaria]